MRKADIEALLELPVEMRAAVAHQLLESLNPTSPDVDRVWATEAERRVKERRAGKATAPCGPRNGR